MMGSLTTLLMHKSKVQLKILSNKINIVTIYQMNTQLSNKNIYIALTSTTLSNRLTLHLSDTNSRAQHQKKHS